MVAKSAQTLTLIIKKSAKDALFAPLYLYQGRKVKRDTLRLPEPIGARSGQVSLGTNDNLHGNNLNDDNLSVNTSSHKKTLNLMIVGDSAAAGVGASSQTEALVGQLILALQQHTLIHHNFATLEWSLQATTGHTSFDILRRLYVLPAADVHIDVMVISVGVNDTTANINPNQWQQQLEDVISIAKRKFGTRILIFSSLPPMAQMPALPAPLNGFIGAKALQLDAVLQSVCAQHQGVHYMTADFAQMAETHNNTRNDGASIDSAVMFAADGFHPSPITYGYWAQHLAALIEQLLNTQSPKTKPP